MLMDLSSKFFTLVPHDFGRMTPPVMDSSQIVQEKKEVMITLSDIELTQSLQKEKVKLSKISLGVTCSFIPQSHGYSRSDFQCFVT